MENRGRDLSRNGSERGSTSNGGDNTSGSDRTNSPSEHSARRAGLRFTDIDPDTWGQRSYRPQDNSLQQADQTEQNQNAIYTERMRLANETIHLPVGQLLARVQAWVNSQPQADQAEQIDWALSLERLRLDHRTQNLPVDQRRAENPRLDRFSTTSISS